MNYRHGLSHTRLDHIYKNMVARCTKDSATNYGRYGGRGITVCEEWKEDKTKFFEWAYKNGYGDDLSLDRKDNNKGYSPENCRWATSKEQANNTRNSRYIEAFGKRMTLGQWAEESGISLATIWARLQRGWSGEDAVSRKVGNNGRKAGRDHKVAL